MTDAFVEPDLRQDEGDKLVAYRDTMNIWTDGVGHAHVAPGTVITEAQSEAQLKADIAEKVRELDAALPWWRSLNDTRQDVILEMCFNMGIHTLLGFRNTLEFIRNGNWQKAHDAMLSSAWAHQVHGRADRLAALMLKGVRS